MRLAAVVFTTFQTVLETGDVAWISWAVVVGFWVTVVATGSVLRRPVTDQTLRWVGVVSMAADAGVVLSVVGNNLTDPAEPIYLVAILAVLEATMRWPTWGGSVGGVVAGIVAAGWTLAVYDRIGVAPEVDFATMRGGIFVVIGVCFGALTRRLDDQHRDLQRILDTSRDLIITVESQTGVVLAANFACEPVLGRPASELVGRPWRDFLDGPDEDDDRPVDIADGVAPGSALVVRRFRHAAGHPVWLELSVTQDPGTGLIHATGRDVTERLAVERQVQLSEQRFRSLFDHNPDAICSFDLQGRFTAANRATEELVGLTLDQLKQVSFDTIIDEPDRMSAAASYLRVVAGEPQMMELTATGREGPVRLEVSTMPIVVDDEVVGVFGMAKDVTVRRQLERELEHRATHDPLTGLPNRAHLETVLGSRLGDRGATLLFVDLDRFKVVNDSLGHRSGDQLLIGAAERLGDCLRSADLLVRWAGDEFCVLLADETSEAESLAVADRLLRAIADPFDIGSREVWLSASVGVAHARVGDDAERLVQMADTAMYEAKRAGRNRLSIYDPDRPGDGSNPLDYELQLRHAVHHDLLTLEYQPIIEVETGRIVALESLLRWRLADGTSHPPDEFIAVAEACGLIRDITHWVMHRACAQLAEWDRITDRTMQVWVNVSALDLQDDGFVPDVVAALAAAGLSSDRLVLEVTESSLLTDVEQVERTLDGLRDLGVALAIDDFGTGYSSMARLHRLRVAACKIDRSFVSGAPCNDQDAAIVRSLTELGEVFGFAVVGEGVETVEQDDAIRAAGCSFAQGYLYGRPCPPDQLTARLVRGTVDLPSEAERMRVREGALPSAG